MNYWENIKDCLDTVAELLYIITAVVLLALCAVVFVVGLITSAALAYQYLTA